MPRDENESPILSATTQPTQENPDADFAEEEEEECWGFFRPMRHPVDEPLRQDIKFSISKPEQVLGRSADNCTVPLSGDLISRRHVTIIWDGKETSNSIVKITDYSFNGTWVNKRRLEKEKIYILRHGDEVALGNINPKGLAADHTYVFHLAKMNPPSTGIHAKYDVDGPQLGRGGYADVNLGLHRESGISVAIKKVRHDSDLVALSKKLDTRSPKQRESVKKEIKAMERLRHLNICRLRASYWEEDGNVQSQYICYLVLDYIDGSTLLQKIQQEENGMDEMTARQIFWQLLNAASYLYSKKIAHRDLKPENIMLTSDNPPIVKLTDFGLARIMNHSNSLLHTPCGSPQYVAPEVCIKLPTRSTRPGYDQKADSFSLGIILHTMLFNDWPFKRHRGEERLNAYEKVSKRVMKWDTLEAADVSTEVKNLIRRLAEWQPEHRMTPLEALEHAWFARYEPPVEHIATVSEEDDQNLSSQLSSVSISDESQQETSYYSSESGVSQSQSQSVSLKMPGAYPSQSQPAASAPRHQPGSMAPPSSPPRRSQRPDDVLRDGMKRSNEAAVPSASNGSDGSPTKGQQKNTLKRSISAVDGPHTRSAKFHELEEPVKPGSPVASAPSKSPVKQVIPERPAKALKRTIE